MGHVNDRESGSENCCLVQMCLAGSSGQQLHSPKESDCDSCIKVTRHGRMMAESWARGGQRQEVLGLDASKW